MANHEWIRSRQRSMAAQRAYDMETPPADIEVTCETCGVVLYRDPEYPSERWIEEQPHDVWSTGVHGFLHTMCADCTESWPRNARCVGPIVPATSLQELFDMMVAGHASVFDIHGQWRSDLPTFGGDDPRDTMGVWSWNETHMIVGNGRDISIEPRQETP